MISLPLKEKLIKLSYPLQYSDTGDFFIVYKRDPYIYGPEVVCRFNKITRTFLFNEKQYTTDQFNRVLDLLVFI